MNTKLLISLIGLSAALAMSSFASDSFAAPPRPAAKRPAPKPVEAEPVAEPVAEPILQRSNRMELDARLVRGETARSGAVYLFQRAPRRLPPLVKLEQSYLDEIVVPVLGAGTLSPIDAELDSLNTEVPPPASPPPTPPPTPPTQKPRGGR